MTGAHEIAVFAPAKINLFLHVGDKRADGYHDICSLAVFADVGDVVTAAPSETLSLTNAGPFAAALAGEGDDNLVYRAAIALQDWARASDRKVDGARLTLKKNLPVASGIGGGSSDAAAALKLLNRVWRLRATGADLARIGSKLGADVPVCLAARASLMEGIGEKLSAWPDLPPLPAILVNPRVSLTTASVFAELRQRSGARAPARTDARSPGVLAAWLAEMSNDLEEPAARIAPIVDDALAEVSATKNCRLARMSGSGATCFGLYETQEDAVAAARVVQHRQPHWWVAATTLR